MGRKKEDSQNGERRTRSRNTGGGGSDGKVIDDLREIEELAGEMAKKTSDYEKELTKLRSQLEEQNKKKLELTQKLNEKETRVAANTYRIIEMNNRREGFDMRNASLEKENKDLKKKHSDLSERTHQVEEDLKNNQRKLKNEQAENLRLKEDVNLASGKDAQGKPIQYKRSEEDERMIRDKQDQIAAYKRELEQVQKVSGKVRQEIQHYRS